MMTQQTSGKRAIVIGASVAGSMMAKLLSSRFAEVLLLDRDCFPADPIPRATVQQEHHIHLLLQRGKRIMESLYPGFLADLEACGAQVVDLSHGVKWCMGGRWKNRWPTGISAHYCSRTLVEYTLRKRAAQLGNVEIRDGVSVQELILDPETKSVVGVKVTDSGGHASELHADIVIDASGRGSVADQWLAALGHGQVEREQVVTKLGYVSRIYRRDPALEQQWWVLLITPRLSEDRRMVAISPIEGDRLMVTTGGWFGAFPDATEESFLSFLKDLPVSAAYEAVSKLEPLSDFKRFKMPGGLRRRYDLCKTWPAGFLVVGDALCSINPIYSQGMTVSSMQVEAVEQNFDAYLAGRMTPQALLSSMVAATERSWQQAKSTDERLPEMGIKPDVCTRLNIWYFDALVDASAQNRAMTVALLEVSNLVETDHILLRPAMIWNVLRSVVSQKMQLAPR